MILITGAAGFIGRHLVARLAAEGRRVRCLVPEHKLLPDFKLQAAEIITGNLLDEEVLFRVCSGVHTIIHLESAQWWGRLRDLERVELVGTRNLIAAARAARVGRIIIVSHLGASAASGYTLMRIKGMVEDMVRASGLAYTIIRSGIVFGEDDAFVNHIAMMLRATPFIFLMPGRGEVLLHPLYVDDLVSALICALDAVDIVDATVEIGGPEYISLEDLLRTVMRVTRCYRLIIPVQPYVLRALTVVYNRLFPRSLITSQWLDILATNRTAPLGSIFNTFGIRPRRFEDTLLTYMPQRGYWWPMLRYTLRRRPRGI